MAGVGEGERAQVADELRRRAAAGHLTSDELTERLQRSRTVLTRAGLDGLLIDLPGGPLGGGVGDDGDGGTARPWASPDAGPPPTPEPAPTLPPEPGPIPGAEVLVPEVLAPAPPAAATGPWAMPTGLGPVPASAPPGHWGPWEMPGARPRVPEDRKPELGVGLWPLPKRPPAEEADEPAAPTPAPRLRPPVEGKRRPVLGLVLLLTIGLVSVTWIGSMAENATEVSDRRPDTWGPTTTIPLADSPVRPPAPTTTAATTGTTLPRLGPGWETLVVGDDLQPGLLTADAEDGTCSWSRVITVDQGRSSQGLANGSGPRPVVEVKPTDHVLLVNGCGPWRPYVPPATPATTMGDGDWLVGADVTPGRYRTSSTHPDCFWERNRDFTGDPGTHLENNGGDGRTVVDLADGERFTAYRCGTWVRD